MKTVFKMERIPDGFEFVTVNGRERLRRCATLPASASKARQPVCKVGRTKQATLGQFLDSLALLKLPAPQLEYRFHGERQWRLDCAWPEQKIALEYQGIFGAQTASHASIGGLMRDYRKFTELSLLGWKLILIDAASVETGEAHVWVLRAFGRK